MGSNEENLCGQADEDNSDVAVVLAVFSVALLTRSRSFQLSRLSLTNLSVDTLQTLSK